MATLMDLIAGYSQGGAPVDDSSQSLGQAARDLYQGLINPKAWQEVKQATQRTTNIAPAVLESLARGSIAQYPGIVGDASELLRKLSPQTMQQIFGNRVAPTTEEILGYVPRATSAYQGSQEHEMVGGLLSPAMGYFAKALPLATKDMPVGNMMIGPESALWNKEMAFEAAKLKKANKSSQEIYEKTGVSTGLDKNFRQEISDESSFLKGGPTFNDVVMNRMDALKINKPTVKDIFYHPQLMEAYPELGNIEIQFIKKGDSANASYSPSENIIRVNGNLNTKQANNSLLHELQHAIQEKEGWAKGADANAYLRKYQKMQNELEERLNQANQALKKYIGTPDYERELNHRNKISQEYMDFVGQDMMGAYHKAKDEYMKVAGEAEARVTQNREKLSMKQRKEIYPYAEGKNAMDINPNDVIYNDVFSNLINGK